MALSPADFAAYSRATGTPYPEDPEERAALAPSVTQFRRNQLRAPEQESNLPGILGAAALGVGALAGGAYAAKRLGLGKARVQASTQPALTSQGTQDVRAVSTADRQRAAEEVTRQARAEQMPGVVQTDLVGYRFKQGLEAIPEPTQQELAGITKNQFNRVYDDVTKLPLPRSTVDPNTGREVFLDPFGVDPSSRQAVYDAIATKPESQLPKVYKPQSGIEVELITDPNTGEIFRRGKSPESFAETYRPVPPGNPWTEEEGAATPLIQGPLSAQQNLQNFLGEATFPYARTDLPTTRTTESLSRQESLLQQTMGALESGEDQMTGRTMRGVQRNEDLDSSQVNEVARQTGSVDVAASMTPDGVPVDQAEGVGYDLRTGEKFILGGSRPLRTGLGPGDTIQIQSDPGSDLAQSSAARFLQKRRLELLGDPEAGTSTRLESKLAEAFGPDAWREDPKATRRRNALKLGAAGNEQFFENINEGTFTVGGEQFPVSLLKEGVFMEDTAQNLEDRANKYRDWLGNIRLKETQKQIRLGAEIEALDKQDVGLMNSIYQIDAAQEDRPASFKTPQQRDYYGALKRDLQGAIERQDELDLQLNQAMREFELSENRLAGAERATTRNIRNASVPQKLASGIEEGIVIRPVNTAPDNIVFDEGELSNLERGRPVGDYLTQEQLEVVPGGLLSGGRAKSVPNIGADLGFDPNTGERISLLNVDVNTGEMLVQKLAGKRMGADPDTGEAIINVRGRGGVAGLDTLASIGIYGPELGKYGTSAMTKEGVYTEQATRPPTVTDTSVGVHKIRTYKKNEEGEDIPVYFTYPSSYEDPQAYKYTQNLTPEALEKQKQSLLLSEKARRGQLNQPKQDLGPYPSSVLARPVRINFPQEQLVKPPVQMAFPSDVVPERGGRVRQSSADIAANQLEAYMSKLQRGRSTPLTSQAVIQPRLF